MPEQRTILPSAGGWLVGVGGLKGSSDPVKELLPPTLEPMARRIIPPPAPRRGLTSYESNFFYCDNCHSETNFTAIMEENFLAGVAITTAPIRAMLYDSPHAQDWSWAATRRISHGPAIRHQQPLRPGLQHGRHNRGLGRNVDRRRSHFCSADGRLSFFGLVGD